MAEGDLFSGCDAFILPVTIDNNAGTITNVVCAIITPGCAVSDPGTLATITFSAQETVGTSALHLSNVEIGTKEGNAVTKQTSGGSVEVSAE